MNSSSKRSLGLIDPTKMTAEQSYVLGQFLFAHHGRIYFFKHDNHFGDDYEITLSNPLNPRENIYYSFNLSADLIRSSRAFDPSQPRFDVISPAVLGVGGQGNVYALKGTLVPQLDRSVVFKNKNNAFKEEHLFNESHKDNIVIENQLTQMISYLRSKNIIFYNTKAAIVMKRLLGSNLHSLRNKEVDLKTPMSFEQRLDITINCLRALEALHMLNILHFDLKPTNILIDQDNDAYLLDFGHSFYNITNPSESVLGTPSFRPHEQQEKSHRDEKSDAFGMGRTFADLWHLDLINNLTKNALGYQNEASDSEYSEKYFWTLPGTKENGKPVLDVINKLTVWEQSKRLSPTEALQILENLRLEMHLKKAVTSSEEPIIRLGFELALQARKELLHAMKLSDPAQRASEFLRIFQERMPKLEKNPLAFSRFVKILGIKAYQHATPENMIASLKKIEKVAKEDFRIDYTRKLLEQVDKLAKAVLTQNPSDHALYPFQNKIFLLQQNLKAYAAKPKGFFTLEEAVGVCEKIDRKLAAFTQEYQSVAHSFNTFSQQGKFASPSRMTLFVRNAADTDTDQFNRLLAQPGILPKPPANNVKLQNLRADIKAIIKICYSDKNAAIFFDMLNIVNNTTVPQKIIERLNAFAQDYMEIPVVKSMLDSVNALGSGGLNKRPQP